ncbi:MAG: Ig-like domain-containing protein [Pedobacter sp.]
MNKHLQYSILILTFLFFIPKAKAQFPYVESFRNSTANGISFGGNASAFLTAAGAKFENGVHSGTPVDPTGAGYLRLTSNKQDQKGYIYSNVNLPSTQGLSIEFEYYIYGGDGADGISFFLFDASVDDKFTIGGFGGSLGYAQITTTNPISEGVSKGYMAIGLDEYGNFSNPTEGRSGGIPGLRPQSVTLRGKGNGSSLTAGNYQFLTTVRVLNDFPINGSPGFNLVGNGAIREPNQNTTGYRRVMLDMIPNKTGPGYYITVKITRGGNPMVTTTVIDNFLYAEAAPPLLRYGLASSTGYQTNFHEIRNVTIDTYKQSGGVDDLANTRTNVAVTIPVINNDVNVTNATVIKNSEPFNGTALVNPDGTVTYTPNNGFSGKDSFTYRLRTDGVDSSPINVVVNVKPVGSPDNTTTLINTPVTLDLKLNDISKAGTSAVAITQPGKGTVTLNVAGTMIYTPSAGFTGTDTFTYKLTTVDGLESDPITVTINVVSAIAKAPDLPVNIPYGQPKKIDIPLPACGTIVIKTPPTHGTLTVSATNEVIYTPTPPATYFGADNFTYVYKDCNNVESLPGTVTITIPKPAQIGLGKALTSTVKNTDGSYVLKYRFTVINPNSYAITGLSLIDDLFLTFPGAIIAVKSLTSTGELQVNSAYNGTSVKEVLLATSLIQSSLSAYIDLEINVTLTKSGGTYNNSAQIKGSSSLDNSEVKDDSSDGLNPVPDANGIYTSATPTPALLIFKDLFIPGGFSPNGDGIHDRFVLENIQGRSVRLQIFNRWSNKIYESNAYENTWDGKTNMGIHIGDDVPTGTYFYIVTIDGQEKRVGHLTINR